MYPQWHVRQEQNDEKNSISAVILSEKVLVFLRGFCLLNTAEMNAYTKNRDARKHWFNSNESTGIRIWGRGTR